MRLSDEQIRIFKPYVEGSLDANEGVIIRDHFLIRRAVWSADAQALIDLEKHYPEGLPLDPDKVEKDIRDFPTLALVVEDIKTGNVVGKINAVKITPIDGRSMDEVVLGEGGWYELYKMRKPDGLFHEIIGVVVDSGYRGNKLGTQLMLAINWAIAENTIAKGGTFKDLTWSGSSNTFLEELKKVEGLGIEDQGIRLEAFKRMEKYRRLELHSEHIQGVMDGRVKDPCMRMHLDLVDASKGLAEISHWHANCPEDIESAKMGTRFRGTRFIEALIEYQRSLHAY